MVLLVAATTENPSFSVVAPLLSRSLILQLQPLGADAIRPWCGAPVADPRGLGGTVGVDDDAVELLVQLAGRRCPPRADRAGGGRRNAGDGG